MPRGALFLPLCWFDGARRLVPPLASAATTLDLCSYITSSGGSYHQLWRPCGDECETGYQAPTKFGRYQCKMDREYRAGSPSRFDARGCTIERACYWQARSKRAKRSQRRLRRARRDVTKVRARHCGQGQLPRASTYAVDVVEDQNLNVSGMASKGKGGFKRCHRRRRPR